MYRFSPAHRLRAGRPLGYPLATRRREGPVQRSGEPGKGTRGPRAFEHRGGPRGEGGPTLSRRAPPRDVNNPVGAPGPVWD